MDLKKVLKEVEGLAFFDKEEKVGICFANDCIEIFNSEDRVIYRLSYATMEEKDD